MAILLLTKLFEVIHYCPMPDAVNPFAHSAAKGASEDELRKMAWERQQAVWAAHLDSTEGIIAAAVLPRLHLAREALMQWGGKWEVIGVTRTETFSGTIHFRAKVESIIGSATVSKIEFIASPKSLIIATEAHKGHESRRWPHIALTAEAISSHIDQRIRDFIEWGHA